MHPLHGHPPSIPPSLPPSIPHSLPPSFLQRQQHRQQQKLDLAPANFPPLPTSEIGVTSPNPAPPPTANHAEEGVSNLADIVKGKRLKDGSVGYLSNGFGGGHQLEKSGSVASSATSGSQPPVQQSNQCAAQTPPQPQPQPQTQPPKPELKVGTANCLFGSPVWCVSGL